MDPLLLQVVYLTSIYYLWRAYVGWLRQRHQVIRERVAYLLWVAAQQVD